MQVDGAGQRPETRIVLAKNPNAKKRIAKDEMYVLLSAEDKEEWEAMETRDKERETKEKAKMNDMKAQWRALNRKDIKESKGLKAEKVKEVKPVDVYFRMMNEEGSAAFKAIDDDPQYAGVLEKYKAKKNLFKELSEEDQKPFIETAAAETAEKKAAAAAAASASGATTSVEQTEAQPSDSGDVAAEKEDEEAEGDDDDEEEDDDDEEDEDDDDEVKGDDGDVSMAGTDLTKGRSGSADAIGGTGTKEEDLEFAVLQITKQGRGLRTKLSAYDLVKKSMAPKKGVRAKLELGDEVVAMMVLDKSHMYDKRGGKKGGGGGKKEPFGFKYYHSVESLVCQDEEFVNATHFLKKRFHLLNKYKSMDDAERAGWEKKAEESGLEVREVGVVDLEVESQMPEKSDSVPLSRANLAKIDKSAQSQTEDEPEDDEDEDASSASGSASGEEPGVELPPWHDYVHEVLVSMKSGDAHRILPASVKLAKKPGKMQNVVKFSKSFADGDAVLSATYSVTTDPVLSKSAQKKKDAEDKKKRAEAKAGAGGGTGKPAPGGLPAIPEEDEGPVPMEE